MTRVEDKDDVSIWEQVIEKDPVVGLRWWGWQEEKLTIVSCSDLYVRHTRQAIRSYPLCPGLVVTLTS